MGSLENTGMRIGTIENSRSFVLDYNIDELVMAARGKEQYFIFLPTKNCLVELDNISLEIEASSLLFIKADRLRSFNARGATDIGLGCIVSKEYMKKYIHYDIYNGMRTLLENAPIIGLNSSQTQQITGLFISMYRESCGNYLFKDDLIRNYLCLVVHQGIKSWLERYHSWDRYGVSTYN